MVFKILFLSAAIQILRISTHYFLAKSIGVDLSIMYFFLIIPIVALASSLPISFGGLGVRENVSVYIFALFGIAREAAFSFEFLAYIVGIAASIPGGIIFILRKRLAVLRRVF